MINVHILPDGAAKQTAAGGVMGRPAAVANPGDGPMEGRRHAGPITYASTICAVEPFAPAALLKR